MCDDFDSDLPDDQQDDADEPEDPEELLADLVRELFGEVPPGFEDEDERPEDAPPTPGEQVLHAFGRSIGCTSPDD